MGKEAVDCAVELVFLGTGTSQGVPPIGCDTPVCLSQDERDKRLRVSVLVRFRDTQIVVDCGPDFRQQMLREQVGRLDAVFFTHEHNDHVAGIDDVRPLVFKQKKEMPLFAEKRVAEAIEIRFPYAFLENPYPGTPRVDLRLIQSLDAMRFKDLEIQPIRAYHGLLPIVGYLFNQEIAYLTDVKTLPNESIAALKGVPILILNALRKSPEHHAHLVLQEALALERQIQPKKMYLTHISHEMGFHEEVQKSLPKNVFLAFDGLRLRA